ncbi:prepilin peptidase [Rhabdaerophilum calidifontis]|uniref:preprotein translocase subunit SecA n=1 Tax=Rhabdaerophilum calidifontis TaxID=2604328 RepID=UPI00123A0658|nr:prepilin peptidase [Rhabdaerophilum calidifontis]
MSEAALPARHNLPNPRRRAEREIRHETLLDRWLAEAEAAIVAAIAPLRRHGLARIVAEVRRREAALARLSDAEIRAAARDCGRRMRGGALTAPALAGEAFALVREASGRVLGKRHHDVQLIGGYALLRGMLAEMNTGEGKTLTGTLAAISAALAGIPVHVVSVNDYLVRRDAEALGPLYAFFGLRVGIVVHGQSPAERRAAYACDVTYCSNKELAFDYLRDRLALGRTRGANRARLAALAGGEAAEAALPVMRGLHFAIIDEADSVLVDEARTPLILSRNLSSEEEARLYAEALALAGALREPEEYRLHRAERRIELTPAGKAALAERARKLGGPWLSRPQREELIHQALTARHLMIRDEHYILRDGKVQIVDEYTGRIMADRFWTDGLHQLVEIKEGCALSQRRASLARLTYQRFFRRYLRLAGMSGTATEVAAELWRVYRLAVARVPPHRPSRRRLAPDRIFATEAEKWAALAATCARLRAQGVPILIGTRSVGASNAAAARLADAGIPHQVLNAAQDAEEAAIIAGAGAPGRVTIATNMAGRGTDILLAGAAAEAGGLHVLLTERHDSRRIDRQLIGRSARQGDPGWAQALLSLEDPLLEAVKGELGLRLARLALASGWEWPARRIIRRAQRLAERQNARIRAELLLREDGLDQALAFSGRPE